MGVNVKVGIGVTVLVGVNIGVGVKVGIGVSVLVGVNVCVADKIINGVCVWVGVRFDADDWVELKLCPGWQLAITNASNKTKMVALHL